MHQEQNSQIKRLTSSTLLHDSWIDVRTVKLIVIYLDQTRYVLCFCMLHCRALAISVALSICGAQTQVLQYNKEQSGGLQFLYASLPQSSVCDVYRCVSECIVYRKKMLANWSVNLQECVIFSLSKSDPFLIKMQLILSNNAQHDSRTHSIHGVTSVSLLCSASGC